MYFQGYIRKKFISQITKILNKGRPIKYKKHESWERGYANLPEPEQPIFIRIEQDSIFTESASLARDDVDYNINRYEAALARLLEREYNITNRRT